MHHALAVSRIQRVQDLTGILHGLAERKRPLQLRSFYELHHQIVGTDIVKLADMRMIQRRHRAGLALESLAESLFRDLDRHGAVQARIARPVDPAHSSGAYEILDPIWP